MLKYNQFTRTELILGKDQVKLLHLKKVAVIGLGGVGSYACEALARAGVGRFLLVDFDVVNLSNLNRQLIALHSTIEQPKTEVMRKRILDINPKADVEIINEFLALENRDKYLQGLDYLVDAIDSLGPKVGLLEFCKLHSIPVVSVMGAGNRLDPGHIKISLLEHSWNCPLARRVRKYLKRRGIDLDIPVVFSSETALLPEPEDEEAADEIVIHRGRQRLTIGSISYMPAIMGMMAASVAIRYLIGLPFNLPKQP